MQKLIIFSKYSKILLVLLVLFFVSCEETKEKEDDKRECPQNCEVWQECSEEYECVLKNGFCDTDLDCLAQGEKVFECNDEHICVEKQEEDFCLVNTCKEWETCNEGTDSCDLITGKCETDEDCDTDFVCNAQKYCFKEDTTDPDNNIISTTIQNLQTDDSFIDKQVNTYGFVTAIALSQSRNPKGLYIQFSEEKYSGIYVYFILAGPTDIKVGDLVDVTGILDRYEAKARIRTQIADIKVIKSGEMPYTPVRVNYFTALEEYESMLTYIIIENRFNLRQLLPEHLVFTDRDNKKLYVKDTISYLNHLELGIKIESLVGILENYNDIGRVLPRSEDDIIVYMPVCESDCHEWEECLDRDVCVISAGRCVEDTDCKNENSSCDESNYCVEPSILDNANIDEWSNGNPTGYLIGSALEVSQEDNLNDVEASMYSAKVERLDYLEDGTDTVEFLSPPISVDYTKNYNLSLMVLDTHNDIDAKIYYKAYDYSDTVIGSGIVGDNEFTQNMANWVELTYTTGFITKGEIWRGLPENLSYIRFGVRLYVGHPGSDPTLPENYTPTGTGYVHVDSLNIEEDL